MKANYTVLAQQVYRGTVRLCTPVEGVSALLIHFPRSFSFEFIPEEVAGQPTVLYLLQRSFFTEYPGPLTMKSTTFTLTACLLSSWAAADYGYQFSNALSTGPTADDTWIREANTTLVLPETNSPQTGNLALWPGMGTSGGDLIQGLAISVSDGRYVSLLVLEEKCV